MRTFCRRPRLQLLPALFALALAAGCSDSEDRGTGKEAPPPPEGPSLFVEGCPVPGLARAARIERPDLGMWGPQALGGEGDFLLMNDRAAFIVTGPNKFDTYYYYGGILVDAVAIDGCEQAGPERYEEFWPLVARIDIAELLGNMNLGAATVRGFRGDSAEVLNDGSDGKAAVVRVRGADDFFWIAEYTLVLEAFKQGNPKPLSSPLGMEIIVDYVLPPDSPVLRIVVQYRNLGSQRLQIVAAAANLFGPTTDVDFYNLLTASIGGFGFKVGVPWITATSRTRDGALGFARQDAFLMNADIAGVDAVMDPREMLRPLALGPAGSGRETASATYFLSVGPSDGNSAERPLLDVLPRPFPWTPYEMVPLAGTTLDAVTGRPIPGARIEVQVRDLQDIWRPLHRFQSDEAGAFGGAVADFGDPALEYRITARVEGRPDPEPLSFHPSAGIPSPAFAFEAGGLLAYEVRDEQGLALPARITLWQDGRLARRILAADGIGTAPVLPGTYEVSVTRGFEYAPFHGWMTVAPTVATPLSAELERVVDTTGFLAMDAHLHAAPSPDSQVPIPDRIRTLATEGVEVAVSTDHEYIGSWQSGIDETGLGRWVATIPGCELTAVVPEHMNIYPVEPRFDLDARGGYVRWYQMDIEEIYEAARARGARIIQLNHPAYLRLIQYDRLTGLPGLEDPTAIGLHAGARLWSWNFDVIELMNGHERPFVQPGLPRTTGYFDDWMSFLNLGHLITAVGTTDMHGYDVPGQPRTYFASSTDEPLEFDEEDLVASLLAGRAVVSDGAFARVEINGVAGLGDLVTATEGTVDLTVRIEAIPEIDVTHFLVFVNCDEILKVAASDPGGVVKYDGTLIVPVAQDAHVVVAGFGADRLPRGLDSFDPAGVPRFITNPIYVDTDGNGIYDPPGGKTCTYDLAPPL